MGTVFVPLNKLDPVTFEPEDGDGGRRALIFGLDFMLTDFFKEIPAGPLYPMPVSQYGWYASDEHTVRERPATGGTNNWKSDAQAQQKATINHLSDIVVQNRLNLLHENWKPKEGDVAFVAWELSDHVRRFVPQDITIQYGYAIHESMRDGQRFWKTREEAQADCDLLNAMHHLAL